MAPGDSDPSFLSHSVAAEADSNKWECFGSRYVFIPIVDVSESIACGEVGVNISWDVNAKENDGSRSKTFDGREEVLEMLRIHRGIFKRK